ALQVNIFARFALRNICIAPPLINMFRLRESKRVKHSRSRSVKPLIEAGHEVLSTRVSVEALINGAERDVLWIGRVVPDEEDHFLLWLSILIQSIGDPEFNRKLIDAVSECAVDNFGERRLYSARRRGGFLEVFLHE